jgi:hypothetical protein
MVIYNIIQLMTFDEVNTRIDQPMKHDIHRGIQSSETSFSTYKQGIHQSTVVQDTNWFFFKLF